MLQRLLSPIVEVRKEESLTALMMFAYSSRGLSHCKEEDTPEPHLEKTIRAYLRLVQKTVAHVAQT